MSHPFSTLFNTLNKQIVRRLGIFLVLFAVAPGGWGQQYPVRVIPVVIPPYSLKLSDYATAADNKLQLQLLMTDLMEPEHQIGIRFSLEAGLNAVPLAQSNDFVLGLKPISLMPGSNLMLSNVDIRPLFELQNLAGMDALQYSRPLPEGLYRFCFQVYDYYTKRNLSEKACATVFLVQYEPPLLNLPQNAEKVQAMIPYGKSGGILFQWMARQMAPNTRYIFTLKEIWDRGQNPVSGFLSSPPLWREETFAPVLFYGTDKSQLIPGKRYAWQVQAKSGNPVPDGTATDDNGVYKNKGLSEIFYFDYLQNCEPPSLLMASNSGRGKVEIRWMVNDNATGTYRLQYRKRGTSSEWVNQESYQTMATIYGLEDQSEYEYRVGSVCGNAQGDPGDMNAGGNTYMYSAIQSFTTDAKQAANNPNYQCGVMPTVDISNKKPLQSLLSPNEEFMAGDFTVTVISAEGNNGIYSGTGYIVVPYLADTRLKVSFSNISLNTDKKLIQGTVETTYDPTESNVRELDEPLSEFNKGKITEFTVDYTISEVKLEETPPPAKLVISGDNGTENSNDTGSGEQSRQELPIGKNYTIKGKNSKDVWEVDEKGNITKSEMAPGGAGSPGNTAGVNAQGQATELSAKGIKVTFKNAPKSRYAFDQPTQSLNNTYQKLGDGYIPYKAVKSGETETIIADVKLNDAHINLKDLVFKTEKGVLIPAQQITGTTQFELSLKGTYSYGKEQIQAVIKQGDKNQIAGAFNLVYLLPKTIKVAIIPTPASANKVGTLMKEVQKLYDSVAVTLEVSIKPPFDIDKYLKDGELPSENKWADLSNYSPQQQQIINDYKKANPVDLSYYLFVSNIATTTGQSGYMPLNGQFGFVFDQNPQTLAHELGHGALQLAHPFDRFKGTPKGAVKNLMDYPAGNTFIYPDWKQINNPALKLYTFQSQEEGESFENAKSAYRLDKPMNFVALSGKIISLPKDAEVFIYCVSPTIRENLKGRLVGFKIGDTEYVAHVDEFRAGVTGNFSGYRKLAGKKYTKQFYVNPYAALNPGKYPISFIDDRLIDEKSNTWQVKIITNEQAIKAANIEAKNGTYAGTQNSFNLTYNYQTAVADGDKKTYTSSCGADDKPVKTKQEDTYADTITDPDGKSKYEIKVYQSPDGKYKVKVSLGGKAASPTVAKQQTAIEQQVAALAEEKLNQLGGLDKDSTPAQKQETEDDGEFWVREMNGRQWLQTLGNLGQNVWENATLPENYWNKDKDYQKANIHLPPTLAGVADGGIDIVSDYPQLIKLGYDIATKEELRDSIWKGIKTMTPGKIVDFAKGALKQKWENYNFTDKPYKGNHELGKDAVVVVKFATGAGALAKGIKETGEKFAKKEIKQVIIETWGQAVKHVDDLLKSKIDKLKKLYPDAKIGYRGSLATGIKHSTQGPFDPKSWDVDAFIVSDDLAKKIGGNGFRDAKKVKGEIEQICKEIEENLKNINGYRTSVGKEFTFRVWTQAEYEKIVKQTVHKLF